MLLLALLAVIPIMLIILKSNLNRRSYNIVVLPLFVTEPKTAEYLALNVIPCLID